MALYGSTMGLQAAASTLPDRTTAPTSSVPCQDVLFIGVRGSGETPADGTVGMGAEASIAWDEFQQSTPGLATRAVSIDYPSTRVTALASPYSASSFFSSIDTGVDKLDAVLTNRAERCPTEHYVLSGKSQGAIVAHRAMVKLATTAGAQTARAQGEDPDAVATARAALQRIDGVITIADPDRVPHEVGTSHGTAEDGPSAHGISYAAPAVAGNYYRPTRMTMDQHWQHADRWHTVCNAGDAVCDFRAASSSPGAMLDGFNVHTYSYLADEQPIRDAADAVAHQSREAASQPGLTSSRS